MSQITSGSILIADPFLKDPNFLRTTVFLCEHQEEGSFGFVLNRKHTVAIGELIDELEGCNYPVYYGGPVQMNSVHFLHQRSDIITGGLEIIDGIFWGGNFEEVTSLIKNKTLTQNQIRFFIGYSGWSEGQLEGEMKEKSWLITNGTRKLVFHRNTDLIWKDALKQLGGEYTQLINYPIDPQLN
jgi:putative transcriptional regulator